MLKQKIGVLHPGEMGAVVAATAANSGHEVYWASEGRGPETRKRAESAGLTDAGTMAQLCKTCSGIVSVCPPENAEQVAADVAGHGFRGLYVDANAVSPERARRMGRLLSSDGVVFVDGCIIGMPARTRGQTWIYLSGEGAEQAASWFRGGPLEVEVLGEEIGRASALKMCFAAHSKGTAALLAAVAATAEVLGVRVALERQWARSGPNPGRAAESIQRAAPKAWRFVGEMGEIADTFESAGIPRGFPESAGAIFARMAGFRGSGAPDLASVLRVLTAGSESKAPSIK